MIESDSPSPDPELRRARRVDVICDRFEQAWLEGRRPRIEEFLDEVEASMRRSLLRELIAIDVEFRDRLGETTSMAEYAQRFPDDPDRPASGTRTDQDMISADRGDRATVSMLVDDRDDDAAGGGPSTIPSPRRRSSVRRYQVLGPHAHGGLGEVSRALDEEVGRIVALKEARPPYADDRHHRARFLREAVITGRLEHPGIVPIYSVGAYPDGRPYYVMRFIEGRSLREALDEHHREAATLDGSEARLRLGRLLRRFLDVCNAIDYAHSRGVVHRDLKPANVMLGPHGETLVIDWGLAKFVGAADVEIAEGLGPGHLDPVEATIAGTVLGTPAYMSPEQAEGRIDDLGPATDIYGLGAILYAVLTGRAPSIGSTHETVLESARRGVVVPPRLLERRVPHPLEAVCLKAMARDPRDRYGSAAELAEDLERYLADEPVSACPETLATRASRWVRRHRTIAATAVGVLLVAAIALGIAYRREVGYVEQLVESNNEAERWLREAMDSIQGYYTGISEDAIKGAELSEALRERLLERPRAFYEKLTDELADKPDPSERERALLAEGHLGLGIVLHELGRYEQAERENAAALASYEALLDDHPDDPIYLNGLVGALNNLGVLLWATGRIEQAEDTFDRAIAAHGQLVGGWPDVPNHRDGLAAAFANMGNLLKDVGRVDEAENAFKQAVAIYDQLVKGWSDVPDYRNRLALAYNNLGDLLRVIGRTDEAEDAFNEAVAIYRRLVQRQGKVIEHRGGLARTLTGLGSIYRITGRSDEAEDAYDEVIATYGQLIRKRSDAPEYQYGLAMALNNRGNLLRDTGRNVEAEDTIDKVLATGGQLVLRRPDVPEYRDGLAMAHRNRGNLLRDVGRTNEAEDAYDEAVEGYRQLVLRQPDVPEYRDGLVIALDSLGNLLRDTGRIDQAEDLHDEALEVCRQLVRRQPEVPEYRRRLANILNSLGNLLRTTGRPDGAEDAYDEAVKIHRQLVRRQPDVPKYRNDLAWVLSNRGNLYGVTGRMDQVGDAFNETVEIRRGLVRERPSVAEYRHGLAWVLGDLGGYYRVLGRIDQAEDAFNESIEIRQGLVRGQSGVATYRYRLASTLNSLGNLLRTTGRPDGAESAYSEAIAAYRRLLRRHPHRPVYRSMLGGTLNNYGLVLAERSRHAEALELYRQAIEQQRPLVEDYPEVRQYRAFLGNHYKNCSWSLRELSRVTEAAEAARESVSLWPSNAGELYYGACLLSLCVPELAEDALLENREALAAEAVATLAEAVSVGWDDPTRAAHDPDLEPIGDRTDFRRLLASMFDRAFPDDPFIR